MKEIYWIILLIILLVISICIGFGVWLYNKIIYKFKNGLVARIHMGDTTIKSYRYNDTPPDMQIIIKETDLTNNEKSFTYFIKENCIEKGNWGRYIDFDYQIAEPINPKNRTPENLLNKIKEAFKMMGAFLDTDLHIKLLRNSKFEDFVKIMMTIILIASCLCVILSGTILIKSFMSTSTDNKCELSLSNQTWNTIYIASHVPPSSMSNLNVPPN
jgi:hypothetical protein